METIEPRSPAMATSVQLSRREFATRAASFGLALGLAPAATLGQGGRVSRPDSSPVVGDPFSFVDPELVGPLRQFPAVEFTSDAVREFRKMPGLAALPAPAPQPVERLIPGPSGAPKVRLWIVDPAPAERDKPVLLHIHGGGYMMPDPTLLPRIQGIATDCHCVVVSVDYRLAPETRFTGSLADNYAALKWVHTNAAELGIDRSRIAIGGESAGGGHAANLAIHARDRKEVPIVFQLLIYPMLDDRTGSSRPVPRHIGHFVWTPGANRLGWTSLLGVPAGSSRVPAAGVPARATRVDGLPPAWIGVGAIDLFVEESMEYAQRLVHAGVATELMIVPGAYHGFDLVVPDAAATQRFTASWKAALRKAFANGKGV